MSNYAGSVSKLALAGAATPFELREVASTLGCGPNRALLENDRRLSNVLCLNEAYVKTTVIANDALYAYDSIYLRPLFSHPIEYDEPGVAIPSGISALGRHVVRSLGNDDRSTYDGRASDSIFT